MKNISISLGAEDICAAIADPDSPYFGGSSAFLTAFLRLSLLKGGEYDDISLDKALTFAWLGIERDAELFSLKGLSQKTLNDLADSYSRFSAYIQDTGERVGDKILKACCLALENIASDFKKKAAKASEEGDGVLDGELTEKDEKEIQLVRENYKEEQCALAALSLAHKIAKRGAVRGKQGFDGFLADVEKAEAKLDKESFAAARFWTDKLYAANPKASIAGDYNFVSGVLIALENK